MGTGGSSKWQVLATRVIFLPEKWKHQLAPNRPHVPFLYFRPIPLELKSGASVCSLSSSFGSAETAPAGAQKDGLHRDLNLEKLTGLRLMVSFWGDSEFL